MNFVVSSQESLLQQKTHEMNHQILNSSLLIYNCPVAEIESEQALVNANKELISRFEKKIQTTIARIWGDVT